MELGLKGRTVIVAGATQGIGAATARELTAEGARVFAMARSAKALAALGDEIGCDWQAADLTDSASVDAAIDTAVQRLGAPSALVISVGAAQGGLFWDLEDKVWQDAMDLKFFGMVRLMRRVAPAMAQAKDGRIVAIVGNNGHQPGARMAPGSAANAACLAAVTALAQELAGTGVSVNALNPGPTRTARWDKMLDGMASRSGETREVIEARMLADLPAGRISEPEEIAKLATVMCSDLMSMVTGTSLTADGGATRGLA
ncbi:SDR family oxidoreductase [Psychromarinibacter halotolerans]|uniref:SDR family oxidoreductase n=1 Tax=Psychromarinibacter halotolerans TaxID=1775175 RepID=A0ABV7H2G5_9RHOB|nr:SDR family oxidoreductase [Psychromarinibacter halotolerans]MDF0596295.1 SDR family oxidoreductase [Psychromarinibacter halotolerans]